MCCLFSRSQQTSNYIQYIFNKAGINPAAAGTNINQKYSYTFGANRQWFTMDNSPKQNFANFSYTIRPPRSYSYWQNVGAMIEHDESGIMSNYGIYLNYTIHLLLRKNLVASVGMYGGFRKFYLSNGFIDPNDPVMQKPSAYAFAYPDMIPGLRLSNKKFFFDLSARQVTINKMGDPFGHRRIGSSSILYPTLFAAYGVVIPVGDYMVMMPSVALNMAILSVPAFNPTLMFYYRNRFGFGVATRNISFISGIFQVRVLENLSIGLAYSYTTSRISSASPNSYEIMMGVVPMGMGGKNIRGRSVAKCPVMDF